MMAKQSLRQLSQAPAQLIAPIKIADLFGGAAAGLLNLLPTEWGVGCELLLRNEGAVFWRYSPWFFSQIFRSILYCFLPRLRTKEEVRRKKAVVRREKHSSHLKTQETSSPLLLRQIWVRHRSINGKGEERVTTEMRHGKKDRLQEWPWVAILDQMKVQHSGPGTHVSFSDRIWVIMPHAWSFNHLPPSPLLLFRTSLRVAARVFAICVCVRGMDPMKSDATDARRKEWMEGWAVHHNASTDCGVDA